MKAVVVYESMFGNTRQVAEAIATGLGEFGTTQVVHVTQASAEALEGADLLIVGGPTHAHGMSLPLTRTEAVRQAKMPESGLTLEPLGDDIGVREWLDSGLTFPHYCAAFDTRADAFKWFTGSAATHIAKHLKHHGSTEVIEEGSFLAPDNDIDLSELDRARDWGAAAGRAALEALAVARA